jgi:ClpP class serine protease
MQAISAGKYKLMGAYWKPLTPEELAMLQTTIDELHENFKDAVNLHREVKEEFMQGQILDGNQALAAGLIDGLVDDLEELL